MMDRNIGAPNRRIPHDVKPKGSTSRDLNREEDAEFFDEGESEDAPLEDSD
ncbi:MAG TPA: hypothetical protein VKT72_16195 [Candidatus Baltobacteraceae bacterium]|nr:hypothetical protein [Candidatus Baltobacteraceae bacterium]